MGRGDRGRRPPARARAEARGVKFVKIWVDDREGAVPKLKPNVYRAIINEAHANGMQVLAHLSRTSALADAKDLFRPASTASCTRFATGTWMPNTSRW